MPNVELTEAQRSLIQGIPERFPPERIDRLWLFPPHHARSREMGFVVLSLIPTPGEAANTARRVLVTIRYEAEATRNGVRREDRIVEEGTAPPERIEKVIAGVLARCGADELDPLIEEIAGQPERWAELTDRLGVRSLTVVNENDYR